MGRSCRVCFEAATAAVVVWLMYVCTLLEGNCVLESIEMRMLY